jgi:hypothetical protein
MKKLVLLFALIGTSVYAQKSTLNRNERIFVENVIKVQNEKPVEITKRKDKHIVVEFDTTILVLKPDGFIGEMWVLGDGDWTRLTEE